MKKVFMVHGFKGSPNGGWRPWLMGELAKLEIYACALAMPNPDAPKNKEWVRVINENISEPNENDYLVGHSLGVPAILNYLEGLEEGQKLGGVFLVSGPSEMLETDNPNSGIRKIDNFFPKPFDYNKIKTRANKFVVFHGDNDDKVPFLHAEKISKELDAELVAIPGGGHLSGHNGFYEFPQLLLKLK